LRSVSGLKRASLCWALFVAVAPLGCGEKFSSAGTPGKGGAGASSSGGADTGGTDEGGQAGDAGGSSSAGATQGGFAGDLVTGGGPPVGGDTSLGGVAGAGGTSPAEPPIPQDGLEAWFRVDFGAVATDGVVSAWKDGSSHGRDASQSATNYRPRLVAAALGGHPAVRFDGVDDFLKLPELDADFSLGLSVFLVYQQDTSANCEGYFEASNGPEIDDLHFGYWQQGLLFEVGANYANAAGTLAVGTPQVAVAVQTPAATVGLRSNSMGLLESAVALAPHALREEVFLGRTLYEGCSTFGGSMGELILYSRAVSDQELVAIEGYLQQKWSCCTE
jgi:hypothetical protein